MFEGSMLESAHLIRTQSRWPAVISFSVQAVVVAALVAVPVLHPEAVKLPTKLMELTAPTTPPKPPEIVHVRADPAAAATPTSAAAAPAPAEHAPVLTTRFDPNVHTDAPPVVGEMKSMVTGDPRTNGTASVLSTNTNAPTVVVATPVKKGPVSISTGVFAGYLLSPIQPVYPPIAKAAHQEGVVTIHAIISKDGRVESAAVTAGPAMLAQAALDAVRNARYRPYLLNGLPTEVDTTFQINFRLNQ